MDIIGCITNILLIINRVFTLLHVCQMHSSNQRQASRECLTDNLPYVFYVLLIILIKIKLLQLRLHCTCNSSPTFPLIPHLC